MLKRTIRLRSIGAGVSIAAHVMSPAKHIGSVEARAAGAGATPRDAASVVVLRQSTGGLEALLLKRPAGARFAGGEWVFPGGSLEAEDLSARCVALAQGADVGMLAALRSGAFGAHLDAQFALGLCFGACRETFEESGILLARHRSGVPCNSQLVPVLQAQRLATGQTPADFCALLEAYDLALTLDALVYYSNWITPTGAPRRFDARFFLAALPPGQVIADQLLEAEAARWLPLEDLPGGPDVQPPITSPPTLLTLRELALLYAHQGSLARLLDAVRTLQPLALMAKMVTRSDGVEGVLPWDAEYEAIPGAGVPCSPVLRKRLGHFPSRIPVRKRE